MILVRCFFNTYHLYTVFLFIHNIKFCLIFSLFNKSLSSFSYLFCSSNVWCVYFIHIFIVLWMHMCTKVCVWRSEVNFPLLTSSFLLLSLPSWKLSVKLNFTDSAVQRAALPEQGLQMCVFWFGFLSFFSSFVSYKIFLLLLFKLKLLLCNIFWLYSFSLPTPPGSSPSPYPPTSTFVFTSIFILMFSLFLSIISIISIINNNKTRTI